MTCSFKRGTVRVPADEEPSWADVASPIVPQTLVNWFAECSRLREVRGLELLDTSHAEHLVELVRSGTGVSIGNL